MSTENTTVTLDGKEIIIETGKMGRLADGACTVTCGETTVMVTAVSQTKMRGGKIGFLYQWNTKKKPLRLVASQEDILKEKEDQRRKKY